MAPLAASAGSYDDELCVTAQYMMVNAEPGAFPVEVLQGEGDGFHVIQMDAEPGKVTIATTAGYAEADGQRFMTHVACKMVDSARVSDVLGLELAHTPVTCRDINAATYAVALAGLSTEQRERYARSGRQLRFAADYVTAGGGEWLPSRVEDFITRDDAGLTVAAPAVRVPWDEAERVFYQGTRHCKLISLAAMDRWMRSAAFADDGRLIPLNTEACLKPHSMTSTAGSCLFWFAPAAAMFCQDYSGAGWNEVAAREACAKRHASPEALSAASSKYEGTGGVFSSAGCADRADAPPPQGTCVFHCQSADETLWHTLGANSDTPAATSMMQRACDLYIEGEDQVGAP